MIYVAGIDSQINSKGLQEPSLHDPEIQWSYYFVDTGLNAGNVYLFAASIGLGAWFHNCDKPTLSTRLGLS